MEFRYKFLTLFLVFNECDVDRVDVDVAEGTHSATVKKGFNYQVFTFVCLLLL